MAFPEFNFPGLNKSSPDHPLAVRLSDGAQFGAIRVDGTGAFGDVITAELLPQAQIDFVYGSHPRAQSVREAGGGSVVFENSMAVCTSGGSIGGVAQINTTSTARYRPGQGLLIRMSAVLGAPTKGARILAGGNANDEDGLFFGVDDETGLIGICRRHGALREIQAMTVSAAATGVETGTVTLDGTGFAVALTSGTIEETAQEISEGDYAGWASWASGDQVYFMADAAETKAGAMSFSSTGTAAGSLLELATGVAPEYEWTPRLPTETSGGWNTDRMDGSGPSGISIDFSLGQIYIIKLQYLGFGPCDFLIENPDTGHPQLVHRIRYANTAVVPLIGNPTLHAGISVEDISAGVSVQVSTGSMAIFTEGINRPLGATLGTDTEGTISAAVPVISVRNNLGYIDGVNRLNSRDFIPLLAGLATSAGSKPMRFSVVKGGTLTNPLWELYDPTISVASVDVSATAIVGGDVVVAGGMAKDGDKLVPMLEYDLRISPGEVMTVVMEPTGSAAEVTASLAWREDT